MGFKRVKLACFSVNVAMAVVCNLSPVLFLTFHELYDISYTLLGLLVLINFFTQLGIDLIFSFFSHKFNIPLTVKLTPVLTVAGILLYAAAPLLFPESVYLGLVLGTVVFSASSGLAEVLVSPVIAAIPAKDPDHEMSKLHSVYAWGVVFVIVVSTLFLLATDGKHWQWLTIVFALVPLTATILFCGATLPEMKTPDRVSGAIAMMKNKGLWLCILAIFLGGASECTMAQWCSGYLEAALNIPKVWGDLFGVAMFAVMLGLGRTLYAKYGKRIEAVLFLGAIGSVACYLCAALSDNAILGLFACAFTGFCTSMMWPGSLIVASERFPTGGVFVFAIMAAGGDLGASVGPQLVGIITDAVAASAWAATLAERLGIFPEQLGMKLGMLVGMLFPLCAIGVYARIRRAQQKIKDQT